MQSNDAIIKVLHSKEPNNMTTKTFPATAANQISPWSTLDATRLVILQMEDEMNQEPAEELELPEIDEEWYNENLSL